MKVMFKKNYIIFFLFILFLADSNVLAKDRKDQYTREDISNYFLGVISSKQSDNIKALKYLKKVEPLKDEHFNFNIEYLRTLVLLNKFEKAVNFSKKVWTEEDLFFESDLLIGLDYFINKDYKSAEKHFERLNKISRSNLFFDDFIGNVLIAWSKATQELEAESFKFLDKIPKPYRHLTNTQNTFLQCYFDTNKAQNSFEKLIQNGDYNFSRYNFFLASYLLYQNKNLEAKNLIKKSREENSSNLLLKHAENLLETNEVKKIKNYFNCKDPKDTLAEFFYVLANLYSSEENYRISNFYINVSLFLNKDFLSNKALLAENLYYQKKYIDSKKVYLNLQSVGPIYSWYSAKSIASILIIKEGKESATESLKNNFDLIQNPNFEHYYELANFYKDNEYFQKSIDYYSLALSKVKNDHFLISNILYRRGTSFERLGNWDNAEKDLLKSLEIEPEDPHVLNYLAYSWIDKGINLDKGLKMLKKATELKKNDGYIVDSLGWAYYLKKNYIEAEKYLQRAVELLPSDPIINDHYADALWMLNKNIQARYFWKYVLNMDTTEKKLKQNISKKILFGLPKNL